MSYSLLAADIGSERLDLGSAYTLRDGTPVREVFSTPADLINLVVPNLFVIAGIMVMVLFILAGYKYLVAGSAKANEEATKILNAGFWGLAVMFAAYWIVQIVKVVTGADIPL